ncbi:uncharacterized protein ColSpa_04854 [Colletotrichum spaethianum]|uniref:Uncharacterized protein n=1 Tax=Colletotrichum spaethianum TaxID=700344 RepID=A0AA37LE05_9PEZI|nr:uncharacterized protein ColSpa_04854 [Colletotrichum spaethianum]GKT44673.1 hypothetical protein ColSpa_04854 [Colletotrichum spaethianum]
MEDLRQLVTPISQHREGHRPLVPEKKPLGTDVASNILDNMRLAYTSVLKNQVNVITEQVSPTASSKFDEMGFTKVEPPAPEQNGTQSRGPRQALPKGLVATRFHNYPVSHHPHRSPPHTSAADSPSFVECDLIDLGADVSSLPRQASDDRHPAFRINDGGHGVDTNHELLLHREIEELRNKLESTTARAEIAEEKAERAEKRIDEIKTSVSSAANDTGMDTESLAPMLSQLKTENSTLKEQLRDAQSHIFSLQPYRKELTPEEVGREYDDLVEGIADWVSKFMDPVLDDYDQGVEDVLMNARRKPTEALRLKRMIHMYPDLVKGSTFPETDEDVIVAIIMRFLNDNIFQKVLYDAIASCVEVLSFVETALQNHVEPKRDLFAIRTWTAEAYNAILSSRQFMNCRDKKARELMNELAGIFKILCRRDQMEWFVKNFGEHCIKPAMQLYEKMLVSTNHFYFDINPYILCSPNGEIETSPDFFDCLHDLDCKNVLQNRKAVNLAKMDPPPSKMELYHHMLNVCTLTPALYMRQIGRNDSIKEPQIVRRQQMLVAWGPQDKRAKFRESGDRTLLYHLYCARSDRERQEAGGWATFRWGS